MADAEVSVTVKGQGFDQLAAQAERAEAALKSMAAAVRGTNATGSAAARATNDILKTVNGGAIGTKLGSEIRASMAAAMGNNGFWRNAIGGIGSRFGQLGKTLGNSMALGIRSALSTTISSGNLIDTALLGAVVYKSLDEAINAAAQRQGAVYRLSATHLVDGGKAGGPQSAALVKLAGDLANRYPNTTVAENLDAITSTLQITGGTGEFFTDDGHGPILTEKGLAELDRFAKLRSFRKTYDATHGTANSEAIKEQFDAAIRSGELMGFASDPEKNASWVEELTDISLASGVSPTEILAAQRTAGLSFLTLSTEARRKFVAMIQENRSSAGVQLATSFARIVSGNNQTTQSNAMLQKLQLLPSSPAELAQLAKAGKIKLAPDGHSISKVFDPNLLKDSKEFATDPFAWVQHDLLPGLRAAILDETGKDIGEHPRQGDEESIVAMLQKIGGAFKDRNAAKMLAEMIIQGKNIDKRAANIGVMSIDPNDQNGLFAKALGDFQSSATDMGGDIGTTLLPKVTSTLEWLSGVMRSVGQFAKENPGITTGAMYGASGLVGLGAASIVAYLGRGLLLPLKLAGGLLRGLGTLGVGAGIATFDLFKGGAGALAGISAKLAGWVGAVRTLPGILGSLGKLFNVLGTIGIVYEGGKFLANTDAGKSLVDLIQHGITDALNSYFYGSPSNHGEEQRQRERRWATNRKLNEASGGALGWFAKHIGGWDPNAPPPDYLHAVLGDKARFWDMSHVRGPYGGSWLSHMQPATPTWAPRSYGRGAGALGGQQSGPVPVVVQSMPKGESKPSVVNVGGVTVNVQSSANPQAIGGAVGSAVGSKVSNALSDQHH